MIATAKYRLPGEDHYFELEQDAPPECLHTPSELNGKEGFVIAPFRMGDEKHPLLLMHPDRTRRLPLPEHIPDLALHQCPRREEREAYRKSFAQAMEQLRDRACQKVVLARTAEVPTGNYTPDELFLRACHIYPDSYVCLFDTPLTGCWLLASPELLLTGDGTDWYTMSLAGTLPAVEDQLLEVEAFGPKNLHEQQLVTDFILRTIRPLSTHAETEGLGVRHAGRIAHLCTPIRFSTERGKVGIGTLLEQLHPTPAVCGEPRKVAFGIIENLTEKAERLYYAGFTGLLSRTDSHIYVSLRTMQLFPRRACIYAGGGLLCESTEQAEWDETCRKMEAVTRILYENT